MSHYCFTERPRELWHEGAVRGWLAGILDFPRLKSWDECVATAQSIPSEIAPEVCCIGENDYSYRSLVVHAWTISYQAFVSDTSEREKVVYTSVLKGMSPDAAMALVRHGLSEADAQAVISEAYALWANSRHVSPR